MPSRNTSQSLNALRPATVLRDYVIESELGSGGFSIVYLARHHLKPDWRYAVKEFLPGELAVRARDSATVRPVNTQAEEAFEDGLRRFRDEAEQLRKFRNEPYIVSCLNYFEQNGTAYLVMDYDDGLPLSEFLTRREAAGQPFTEADLLSVIKPLLEGLTAVHRAGVLHRDIKPGNVFVRRQDDITGRPAHPVLIDFGAARQNYLERHSRSRAPYTPGYAAYEQVSSEGDIGPWTDVYAMGALMWRMVAGGCAGDHRLLVPDVVDGADGCEVWSSTPRAAEKRAYALHRGRPDPMASAAELGADRFSPALLQAIDGCLTLYPEGRAQSCDELRTMLTTPAMSEHAGSSNASVNETVHETNADTRSKRTLIKAFVAILFVSCIEPIGLGITGMIALWLFWTLICLPLIWLASDALTIAINLLFRFDEPLSSPMSFSSLSTLSKIAFLPALFLLLGWFRNWWRWPSTLEKTFAVWSHRIRDSLPLRVQQSSWLWRTQSLFSAIGFGLAMTGFIIWGTT